MSESLAEENRHLRNTVRGLVALSTLPVVWAGYAPERIVASLTEILLDTLLLDLIYVRVGDVEVARGKGFSADKLGAVAEALAPWLAPGVPPESVTSPLGGRELRVAVSRFGHTGGDGAVIACSRRPDFPTESDRLLLGVGANQTAIVLQRKRAELSLAEERERLRVTLSSIGDAVIATDAEGRMTFMNGVAESLTGWPLAEAAGRPLPEVFRIVNERTREPGANPALRALSEGVVVGLANHTVLLARDGTERPIDDSAAPIRDGRKGPIGAVLVFRDVTERRRAEDTQARLAAIVESSADAIVSKSLDGIILSWNAGAQRLFGYAADEAVGQPITLIIPPERLEEESEILERLRRGERVEHFETVRMAKDGRRMDLSLTISPICNTEGRVVGASKVARDITDRKRSEEAIREGERRFRALVTTTSDVVYRMSAEWEVMQPLEGRGLVASNADPIRDWMQKNLPRSEHPRVQEAIHKAIANKSTFELEHQVNRPDGTIGWTFSRAVPILDAAGEIVEWFGTARDVTVQKQAEIELARVTAESERRKRLYETILTATPDFVYVFSLDHRVLYANDSLLAMWGRRLEDTIGKTFVEVGYEPWHAEMHGREIDQIRVTKKPIRGEVPFTGTNGRRIYDYIFVPVVGADGEVEVVAGTTRDVTDRKGMEDALRESEERFRLMADAVPVLVWVSDTSKRCVWFNKSWLDFTGRLLQELLGNGWADDVHPDDFERCLAFYVAEFDARRPFTMEYRLKRHDGEYRWVEDNGIPRFDGQGVFAGYIGSCVDFTDRKGAEEALRQVAADLSEADRKKDEFIALLAHELRNPLAPIRNGLQVIRLARGDAGAADRAREMMDRQLSHMVRLIDDLLDISRINRGKMELRRSRVTLADVVSSAVETARPVIDAEGHEFAVTLPQPPVYLDADLTRLSQVFSNLLTNSAKYTPKGGRIWLTAERKGDEVSVSVRDTGVGIPTGSLANIFDMFSQVDRSIERSTGGLGIGLALVKGLVEMHGGTVTAASEGEGRGSIFTVTLPELMARPQLVPAESGNGQARTGPRRRILVVDDNRDGADSLAMMLRFIGNEVRTAHDGIAAVELAETFKPEIILMDVGMPRLNGLDATRRIREQDCGKTITIIALTGWGQDGDKERSREAGCNGHLVKPVNLPDLETMLGDMNGK